MTEPDEMRGTTRRALLRNSALGVGAIVGGAAVVTAGASAAGAGTPPVDRLYLDLDGVPGAVNQQDLDGTIALRTVSWSLAENIDTLSDQVLGDVQPSLVVLTMTASKASSALLKRLVNGHSSATGKILLYRRDVQGVERVFTTVTLTDVRVVGFHQTLTGRVLAPPGSSTHGSLVDTVKLTYASLDFRNLDSGKESTYTVPPPP